VLVGVKAGAALGLSLSTVLVGLVVDEVRETFTLKTFQERVFRLEAENKELKVTNSILQTQYNSHCETQSDILRTLHANLDENYSKIEESDNRIQRLEQQLEKEKEDYKEKLEAEREKWDLEIQRMQCDYDLLKSSRGSPSKPAKAATEGRDARESDRG